MRLVVLAHSFVLAVAAGAASAAVDVVGGTGTSALPNPWNAKGNTYRVDTSTTLLEQEFYLGFSGERALTFWVYRSPTEFGTYQRIHQTNVTATEAGWVSSGAVSVPLSAGQYYILAVSPLDGVRYHYDTIDRAPTSFGEYLHGHAGDFHPLGATITHRDDDSAAYYHRVTTGVPEPSAGLLLVASLCAAGGSRHLSRARPGTASNPAGSD
jgi:hypothetical protein